MMSCLKVGVLRDKVLIPMTLLEVSSQMNYAIRCRGLSTYQ